jgi:hypothetical protein
LPEELRCFGMEESERRVVSGGVYLVRDDGKLVEMSEKDYDSEDLLQRLIAYYPNLLAGDQVDAEDPRRWLLVAREVDLASEEEGSGRWSVDHLFLDQDAIPTIVEVKRSSNPEIRRKIVGQMLDYAANGVVYWPVSELRARWEAGQEDSEAELSEFLGPEAEPEEFWQKVEDNLRAGRVRLLFVADEIPSELRRIVEFLNEQMSPAEVLALEIKQYVGEGMKTLVPRIIGRTEEAQQKKSGGALARRQWDEQSFFAQMESDRSSEEIVVARKILDWSRDRADRVRWGEGQEAGFAPTLDHGGFTHQLFAVYAAGHFYFYFQYYSLKPPFESEEKRIELLERLNSIPGIELPRDSINRRPSISLAPLLEGERLRKLLETFDWVVQEIRAS